MFASVAVSRAPPPFFAILCAAFSMYRACIRSFNVPHLLYSHQWLCRGRSPPVFCRVYRAASVFSSSEALKVIIRRITEGGNAGVEFGIDLTEALLKVQGLAGRAHPACAACAGGRAEVDPRAVALFSIFCPFGQGAWERGRACLAWRSRCVADLARRSPAAAVPLSPPPFCF
jgi:hypothetical protein